MRKVHVKRITEAVQKECIAINYYIGEDIKRSFDNSLTNECSDIGKEIIIDLLKNAEIAKEKQMPLCQDTGMVVAFVKIGQEVYIDGGSLEESIQAGVRKGYEEGFLRKSVVKDPLIRENTKDNTPAIIYYEIVPGDIFEIALAAKGFGSENMSRSKMLKPSDGIQGVEDFIVETVSLAGPNPCPPIVVGVGVGGTLDKAAQLAKKALLLDVDARSELSHLQALEERALKRINALGIGPQGLGGSTTALGVNILSFPTHIAGLPVVVNINCHSSRHGIIKL